MIVGYYLCVQATWNIHFITTQHIGNNIQKYKVQNIVRL
jgi:hypothetical protein